MERNERRKRIKSSKSMRFKNFQRWVANESTSMSAKEVCDYIAELTPSDSDVPDYFIDQVKKSGKRFHLETVNIEELLKKDKSLAEYVKSGEIRYGEDGESDLEPYDDELDYPIVIFKGEVIDGYSRTSTLYSRGVKTIKAYISE